MIKFTGQIDINLGDIVLVAGDSGSGKSTLLYALKGLLPDVIFGEVSGEICFNGLSINSLSVTEKLKIGLVQQNPDSQIINNNVLQELAFGLENLSIPPTQIKDKIHTVCKRFNLEYLLNRDTNTLSGGEKQKVALLSVLLTDPEVILLDEPTAFLDPESAEQFIQLLNDIRHNKTIIIIEHNVRYLKNIVNRYFRIGSDGVINEYPVSSIASQIKQEALVRDTPSHVFTNAQPLLSVKNLSYTYSKANKLLNNINVEVYPKHILGIIGKSGAGKSTLLKILARFIKTENLILFNNVSIKKLSNKDFYLQIGLLFQNPENHFLYTTVLRELNNDATSLEYFNLEKCVEQNPFTLSEGQKRRLSFATLKQSFSRKIYLLDEPTFGQDYTNKLVLMKLINQMREDGASFIIVSHDYNFINTICDNIVEIGSI